MVMQSITSSKYLYIRGDLNGYVETQSGYQSVHGDFRDETTNEEGMSILNFSQAYNFFDQEK